MARIRTIKPEFFTSEDIVDLTPLARLFYVSLWCEADREGRLVWKPKTLKLRYFPADDCDIEKLGDELIQNDLIYLYEIGGIQYAEIPGFTKHQVINNRETASILPPNPKKEQKEANAARVNDASSTRESGVLGEGKGRERKGKEGKGKEDARARTQDEKPTATWKPPEWINKTAWAEFEHHRRDIREPLSDLARTKAANQLRGLTHAQQQACVDMTIQNRWKGLFPEKAKRSAVTSADVTPINRKYELWN